MANEDQESRVILRYEVDRRSLSETAQSTRVIEREIDSVKARVASIGAAARDAGGQLRSRLETAVPPLRQIQTEAQEARQELQRLGSTEARPRVILQQSGVSRQGAGEAVDRLGSVSSQILSGLGSSEAANTAGLIGDIGGALSSLNPIGLATIAVGTGLAAVLGEVARQAQEAKEEGESFAGVIAGIAGELARGTTSQDIQSRIDTAQAEIAIRQEQANALQPFLDANREVTAILGEALRDPAHIRPRADGIVPAPRAQDAALRRFRPQCLRHLLGRPTACRR